MSWNPEKKKQTKKNLVWKVKNLCENKQKKNDIKVTQLWIAIKKIEETSKNQDEMRRNSFLKFFGVKKAKKKQTFQI